MLLIRLRQLQAEKAFKQRQFSFSFYRSSNKHAKQHGQATLHKIVGQRVVELLSEASLIDGELQDSFFAEYKKGQFISYHTDGSAGKYAFIYQLSTGWQHKFGGQLELYPKRIKFFKKSLPPSFNTHDAVKVITPNAA